MATKKKPRGSSGAPTKLKVNPRILIGALAALALVVGVAAMVGGSALESKAPSRPSGSELDYSYDLPDTIQEAGVPAAEAGCSDVESPPDQGSHLVKLDEDHPEYSSTPPTSGWYRLGSLTPALYYADVADPETLLRNMAEGGVVIWHTGLSEEEIVDLKGAMVLLESELLVGVTGDSLGLDHKVVLTAWGKLQRCEELSGEAIADFFAQYHGQGPLSEVVVVTPQP